MMWILIAVACRCAMAAIAVDADESVMLQATFSASAPVANVGRKLEAMLLGKAPLQAAKAKEAGEAKLASSAAEGTVKKAEAETPAASVTASALVEPPPVSVKASTVAEPSPASVEASVLAGPVVFRSEEPERPEEPLKSDKPSVKSDELLQKSGAPSSTSKVPVSAAEDAASHDGEPPKKSRAKAKRSKASIAEQLLLGSAEASAKAKAKKVRVKASFKSKAANQSDSVNDEAKNHSEAEEGAAMAAPLNHTEVVEPTVAPQPQKVINSTKERLDMGRCWHWITDKFWDGLAFSEQEGEDNFIGKMLNPNLRQEAYGSGGAVAQDVAALALAGIIGLSKGNRQKFRTDPSMEGWRIRDRAECTGSIAKRNVTASCCNNVIFSLAFFPKLNHVAILLEAAVHGAGANVYSYHVIDPTFNTFHRKTSERQKVEVLMEDLQSAGRAVKAISGGMTTKEEYATGYANYQNFKQYFISLRTFLDHRGDLRYPPTGPTARFRTFKDGVDPTVCFGHGALLAKAAQKWRDGVAIEV